MSQYASAMKRNSGYAALTRAISGGQYSSSGGVPPHVRAKISLHISIAMSQRSPSHCAARSSSVSPTASRSAGANALSCTTSGHGGKYGSRPRATQPAPTCTDPTGSAGSPGTSSSGRDAAHGWSGATWFGT